MSIIMAGVSRVALMFAAMIAHAHPAAPLEAKAYLRERGWTAAGERLPRSPSPDLIPLQYTEKSGMGATCGLLARTRAGQPAEIALAGPESGEAWPDCISIDSMIAFKLGERDLVAVNYLVRDTRDDYYRHVDYIYRNRAGEYVVDEDLSVTLSGYPAAPQIAKAPDVVRYAQAKQEARRYPDWHFEDSHFIADTQAWFAVLKRANANQCRMLVHAGGQPVAFNQPGCREVLATTRLERTGTIYYLVMFELRVVARHIAVISVTGDRIKLDTALSSAVSRTASSQDIGAARAALARALR